MPSWPRWYFVFFLEKYSWRGMRVVLNSRLARTCSRSLENRSDGTIARRTKRSVSWIKMKQDSTHRNVAASRRTWLRLVTVTCRIGICTLWYARTRAPSRSLPLASGWNTSRSTPYLKCISLHLFIYLLVYISNGKSQNWTFIGFTNIRYIVRYKGLNFKIAVALKRVVKPSQNYIKFWKIYRFY